MKNQNLIVTLIVLFISICVCPIILALLYFVIDSTDQGSISGTLATLCLAGLCIVPVLATFTALGFQLVHTLRSPKAARRLAEELNLQALNEAPKDMGRWYGGQHAKREFAIKPYGSSYRYFAAERSRTGVKFYLRILMEVRVSQPLGVFVHRPPKDASKNPAGFDEAFETENGDRLSPGVRQALFAFVEKGYPTGISGVSLRLSKGYRNLYLNDRAAVRQGALAPEALPDAQVILMHDHPDTNINKETLLDLLDDLAQLAQAVENQFNTQNTLISQPITPKSSFQPPKSDLQ